MRTEYILILVLLAAVVALAIFRRRPDLPVENFLSFRKPTLWWFVDTEMNARSDTSQNSDKPNRGYLQVALEAVKRTQGADFAVSALVGRDAVLNHLPEAPAEAKLLPPALWRNWVIANLLAKYGGVAMDGNSTLFVGPSLLPHVKTHGAAMFGTYPDEPVVNPETASAPGPAPYAGWAAKPNHPAWTYAAGIWNSLASRGPQAWSSAIARRTDMSVWMTQKQYGAVVVRSADGGRLPSGKARQLEDLFGRVANPVDPNTTLVDGTVYVSYDGDNLSRRHEFNWFLRLSPEQIRESDLVWAALAG